MLEEEPLLLMKSEGSVLENSLLLTGRWSFCPILMVGGDLLTLWRALYSKCIDLNVNLIPRQPE